MKAHPIFDFQESKSKIAIRKKILNFRQKNDPDFKPMDQSLTTASSQNTKRRYAELDDSLENNNEKEEEDDLILNRAKTEISEFNGDYSTSNLDASYSRIEEESICRSAPLQQDNNEEDRVVTVLNEAGLGKFVDVFMENGFNELEILLEVSDEHFKAMKIPKGFQIKLNKRLDQIKEQMEPNEEHHEQILDKEFLEEKREEKIKVKVETKETSCQGTGPMSEPGRMTFKPMARQACYNCFQMLVMDKFQSEFAGDRVFCTNKCLKTFLLKHSVSCKGQGCQKSLFLKQNGVFVEGTWFCSQTCSEKLRRDYDQNRSYTNLDDIQEEDEVLDGPLDQSDSDLNNEGGQQEEEEEDEVDMDFSDF